MTVGLDVPVSRAIAAFDSPSAARSTIRERRTIFCGELRALTQASRVARASPVIVSASAESHIVMPRYRNRAQTVKLFERHYTSFVGGAAGAGARGGARGTRRPRGCRAGR